jgi:hypothetical protein
MRTRYGIFTGLVLGTYLAWLHPAAPLVVSAVVGVVLLLVEGLEVLAEEYSGVEVGTVEELRRQREEVGR